MSVRRIKQYHNEVANTRRYSNKGNESVIRQAFLSLLNDYAKSKNLMLIAELPYPLDERRNVIPDGTLKDASQLPWGYWESKDEDDDLEDEIKTKFAKGYPDDNILFEDSQRAVLYQAGERVFDVLIDDADALHEVLTAFVSYEPEAVRKFHRAITDFRDNIPVILDYLRNTIEDAAAKNNTFVAARDRLLDLAQDAINPHLTALDIREMVIQHILTEDIFLNIFADSQFHRENNIAQELNNVTKTFFTGATAHNVKKKTESFYSVIREAASRISDHHEKQAFLKLIYENFYKIYNPKAADRMGIVYTPNEIVRFMIESTDYLLEKHFDTLLSNKHVNILDPATGTGTFVTELIEYMSPQDLAYKYEHEIFCNEMSLLSYYTANLNIEYTYAQKMQDRGGFVPFNNIAFVDTLENLNYVGAKGQFSMFELTAENLERIKRQNEQDISVIIGNPPYNANQLNENDNNKNRPYPAVDQRIKDTYIKESTAQKTKVYDMYARFIRWASDRLNENGVIAFVVNRSFIDSRTFDGFRKVVATEFDHIYVMDLGGDVRANPKLSGPKHNVFAIQTGVAIVFFVREAKYDGKTQIRYVRRPEMETAEDKLAFLRNTKFKNLDFERLQPDKHYSWLNQSSNDWEELLPVATSVTKSAKSEREVDALFKFYAPGVSTNRDEWVYDYSKDTLIEKMSYFITEYTKASKKQNEELASNIKWSRDLKRRLVQGKSFQFNQNRITTLSFRPYVNQFFYAESGLADLLTTNHQVLHGQEYDNKNVTIAFIVGSNNFACLACASLFDLNYLKMGNAGKGTQGISLYRYDDDGNQLDNITDWGVQQFQQHYQDGSITREAIFHYTYAVLHDPIYREKYELNLKREFPRVPFYADFWQWSAWGKTLMDTHINFEDATPYELTRKDKATRNAPKAKLKADKTKNHIILDDATTLEGVPAAAWDYKLGNRSALEWVLDRYKEKKPRDPTVREKFNTYRFEHYKEDVITLLKKVCTVSVVTVEITEQMAALARE
jgi:predicted helicase